MSNRYDFYVKGDRSVVEPVMRQIFEHTETDGKWGKAFNHRFKLSQRDHGFHVQQGSIVTSNVGMKVTNRLPGAGLLRGARTAKLAVDIAKKDTGDSQWDKAYIAFDVDFFTDENGGMIARFSQDSKTAALNFSAGQAVGQAVGLQQSWLDIYSDKITEVLTQAGLLAGVQHD